MQMSQQRILNGESMNVLFFEIN